MDDKKDFIKLDEVPCSEFIIGIIRDLKILFNNVPSVIRGLIRLLLGPLESSHIDDELHLWLNPNNTLSFLKQIFYAIIFPVAFLFWIFRISLKYVPDRNPLAYPGNPEI